MIKMLRNQQTRVKVEGKELLNNYSLGQKIILFFFFVRTKWFCNKIRIIRFPMDVRGKNYIDFGTNLSLGVHCRFEAFSVNGEKTMFFGNDIQINDYVHISSMKQVKIGNNVLIAGKVYISDNSHGLYSGSEYDSSPEIKPILREYNCKPVKIEDNVWIGESVTILPGVTIGKGSIIGANSVVTKTIPSNVIAVGSPAKPIKKYDFVTQTWKKII